VLCVKPELGPPCTGGLAGRTVNAVLHLVHTIAWQLTGLGSASRSDWHLRTQEDQVHVRSDARLPGALPCSTTWMSA
jgi:hypothetical protein